MVEISSSQEKNIAIAVNFIKKGQMDKLQQMLGQTELDLAKDADFTGMTPLHHATIHGNLDAIKFIVSTYGGLEVKDCHGRTPFHLAAQCKSVDVINLLSELDDSDNAIDIQSNGGMTPLMYAARAGNMDACVAVLNNKANPFLRDKMGKEAID